MKIFRNEDGQTLVLTALCMTAMLGFMALAIDVGLLFRARRNMQITADAVAVAAALDYYYNGSKLGASAGLTHAQSAGQTAAVANGITNGTNGTVVVNCHPTSGPKAGGTGCNGYFEALVWQPSATTFMGMFGTHSVNVSARAVAGTPVASDACIWVMDPTASNAIVLQGSAAITAPGCGVYVNSSSPTAAKFTGNPSYTGPDFDIYGGSSGGTNNIQNLATNVAPISPPIPMDLTGPDPSKDCTQSYSLTSLTAANNPTFQQGNFAAGSAICFTNLGTPVTLNDGVNLGGALGNGVTYVFQDGVIVPAGAHVNIGSSQLKAGSTFEFDPSQTYGATLDLWGGTITYAGSGQSYLSIYAPTSGTYNSLAIMQPKSNTTSGSCPSSTATICLPVQFGSSGQTLDGLIYAPGAQVYLQDNGSGVTASGVITDTMFVKSSNFDIPGYSRANADTTPFRIVTLTE